MTCARADGDDGNGLLYLVQCLLRHDGQRAAVLVGRVLVQTVGWQYQKWRVCAQMPRPWQREAGAGFPASITPPSPEGLWIPVCYHSHDACRSMQRMNIMSAVSRPCISTWIVIS